MTLWVGESEAKQPLLLALDYAPVHAGDARQTVNSAWSRCEDANSRTYIVEVKTSLTVGWLNLVTMTEKSSP